MSFLSTRGGSAVTASQAIIRGLAPDGGLYVPSAFPEIDRRVLHNLADQDYLNRAVTILGYYLEDFTRREIEQAVRAAYTGKFDDPRIAPLHRLDGDTWMLELFHGPTLAFKDMALQLLPHLTAVSAQKNGEKREISILVATSGDTGKAALEGFRDVPGTSCTVFYPQGGVSDIQRMQMTTTLGSNTHVIAVQGNFDDAQTGVKALFSSEAFAAEMDRRGKVLSSANSINFGRLVPQIVYYFSAYADLINAGAIDLGDPVNFVVPTGNFGNILACQYAQKMGLPVGKMICASNRNNVLTDFFGSGRYSTHRTFFKTTSPSMDILVSSNLERLLYELADRDGELIRLWMEQLKRSGSYEIGQQRLDRLRRMYAAGCADDNETAREIRTVFERHHYLMDTHTAVASKVLREYRAQTGDPTPTVVVSTASPYKFAQDVLSAVKGPEAAEGKDAFECASLLEELSGQFVPSQVSALRTLPERHRDVCPKDGMAEALLAVYDRAKESAQ